MKLSLRTANAFAGLLQIQLLAFSTLMSRVAAKDECQPYVWGDPSHARSLRTEDDNDSDPPKAGEINCRKEGTSPSSVNYYTCTQMANDNQISVETFFLINPALKKDCSDIQANKGYCVDGWSTAPPVFVGRASARVTRPGAPMAHAASCTAIDGARANGVTAAASRANAAQVPNSAAMTSASLATVPTLLIRAMAATSYRGRRATRPTEAVAGLKPTLATSYMGTAATGTGGVDHFPRTAERDVSLCLGNVERGSYYGCEGAERPKVKCLIFQAYA
ncbi:hypothetical protein PITC_067270 [Penicillium italicum]|uniref:LysM domain-containing protein n=1 Tax=Penicillium italicum TaxID=40296 RepID=A0A0A2KHP7_PENIT|nr:hypothetical protein PITC_067270 [Penicillium italicum]